MVIAEEDGLVVDLVVGGITRGEVREKARRPVPVERVDAVARLLRLIDLSPATDPPDGLVEQTLRRIERRDGGRRPAN